MSREVRTRFAPSPTGYMHIGNLRTALFEYLIAKSNNGKFILRIEDTDQKRYVEGAVDVIYKTMKIAGIKHDEGPDIGGDYGPYIQSQRKDIYVKYAKELVEKGKAYYCFCPKESQEDQDSRDDQDVRDGLDDQDIQGSPVIREGRDGQYSQDNRDSRDSRDSQSSYNKRTCPCISLTLGEAAKRIESGQPCVIRQKMPRTGTTSFHDAVYGTITVENSELEDQVLIKSDLLPTYNFANVIDDHLMKITHVVRGSEYLSSTPKYNLLYEAFGWEIPVYVHLPLITKKDGSKLSKRAGDPSFEDLISMGYLPEAIVNYVTLLGWSPGDEREFFTMEELEKEFAIKGISKSPSVFDMDKLRWMNGEYIRKKTPEEFHRLALPYYKGIAEDKNIDWEKVSAVLQKRTEVLGEIPESIDFLDAMPEFDISFYRNNKMKTDENTAIESLKAAYEELKDIHGWNAETIHDRMIALVSRLGIKNGQLLFPLRIAITGKQVTPGGAIEIADILGKEETLRRLEKSISALEKELANSQKA